MNWLLFPGSHLCCTITWGRNKQKTGVIHQKDALDQIKLEKPKDLGHQDVLKPKGRRNVKREFGCLGSDHPLYSFKSSVYK